MPTVPLMVKKIDPRKSRPYILTRDCWSLHYYTLNPWREVEDGLTSSPRYPTFYTSFNHSIQSRRQLREKNLESRNPRAKITLGVKQTFWIQNEKMPDPEWGNAWYRMRKCRIQNEKMPDPEWENAGSRMRKCRIQDEKMPDPEWKKFRIQNEKMPDPEWGNAWYRMRKCRIQNEKMPDPEWENVGSRMRKRRIQDEKTSDPGWENAGSRMRKGSFSSSSMGWASLNPQMIF